MSRPVEGRAPARVGGPARPERCCESRVKKALGRLDGVRRVGADHSRGEVRVAFEPAQISAQELRDGIERAGYAVAGEAGASG